MALCDQPVQRSTFRRLEDEGEPIRKQRHADGLWVRNFDCKPINHLARTPRTMRRFNQINRMSYFEEIMKKPSKSEETAYAEGFRKGLKRGIIGAIIGSAFAMVAYDVARDAVRGPETDVSTTRSEMHQSRQGRIFTGENGPV